jgi:hypothetical protein
MKPTIFDEPLQDEELEARALRYFEAAREEGSLLPDLTLMRECREMAHRDVESIEALGDEVVEAPEE